MIKRTQQGAMFGLDARIALAIFGALSVISGAALYSAIQEVKVTAAMVTLTELEKAIESYYIDMGYLPMSSVHIGDLRKLIENKGDVGWNGPYIASSKGVTPLDLKIKVFGLDLRVESYIKRSVRPGLYQNGNDFASGNNYYLVINFNSTNFDLNYFKILDEKFDGSDGALKGKIQAIQYSNMTDILENSSYSLVYKTELVYP